MRSTFMLLLLGITYTELGGVSASHRALAGLAERTPEGLSAAGMTGWTSMPILGSPIWYTLITTLILGVGIGVLAQPQLVVRFMTVRSGREINRAVLVGGVFILVMTGTAFTVSTSTRPLPPWFAVLFTLSLLAAAMSTISSQFHTMGTAIGRDVYEQGVRRGRVSEGRSILISRLGIVAALLITVGLALWLPSGIVAAATAVFFGTCAAAFFPAYVGGLFTTRITPAAAGAGMVAGFVVALLWLAFAHAVNAERLLVATALFGRTSLVPFPWNALDPLVVALPASLLVTLMVSLVARPLETEHLDRCMAGVRRRRS